MAKKQLLVRLLAGGLLSAAFALAWPVARAEEQPLVAFTLPWSKKGRPDEGTVLAV